MRIRTLKYIIRTALPVALALMVFGVPVTGQDNSSAVPASDSVALPTPVIVADSISQDTIALPADSAATDGQLSLPLTIADWDEGGELVAIPDTTSRGRAPRNTTNFLDDIISGHNTDSLVYDPVAKMAYIYTQGDVTYTDANLKADYIEVDLETKNILAHGVADTSEVASRPEFYDKSELYVMDTIVYNLSSKKAKVRGLSRQEGEGYLLGDRMKKMPDNTINIAGGMYTTCDHDPPHFYIHLTKAKLTSGETEKKKVIFGPAYLVMEDVPIPFLGLPFGFFPLSTGRSSGFIMPSYGEVYTKGFFLRDGGYYFAINDYIDLTLTGGFYTLGSWEAQAAARYIKRYKYSGSFNVRYSQDILGERGSADYVNQNNFRIQWSHRQDTKASPNSTFSASVNFSTSGYSKHSTNNLQEHLNTQTNSSIAYSKTWAGTPFSLSTNISHSQNSRDTTVMLSVPNLTFTMTRIFPFKRSNPVGRERWYEKISLSYTGTLQNSVTAKEYELFKPEMYDKMRNGVNHQPSLSMSFNVLNYLNISPGVSYKERWYFRKIERSWDPAMNEVVADTTQGFYRLYDYSFSLGLNTKLYGLYTARESSRTPIRAIRHMITPSISAGYTPDFGDPKYGFWKWYQSDSTGTLTQYSPWADGIYGTPGRGESASMSFSLSQNLEMKVRSRNDSTGVRKVKVIDELKISGSWNFLADSMNLSNLPVTFRTTIYKNFGLNLNMVLDPYQVVNENGRAVRINKFMLEDGKLARISSASTSFGYSFNGGQGAGGGGGDPGVNTGMSPSDELYMAEQNITDPNQRRLIMTNSWYDFSLPWNLSLNYSFNYSNNGVKKTVTQTAGFNGHVNPTDKWNITFSGGYDFKNKKLTPGQIGITRDLHCWTMSFSWVPVGYMKQWSFTIRVKSSVLQDLKYDRRSSRYDNYDF